MSSERPEATVSTKLLMRIVIILVACWSAVAGTILVGFHGTSTGALGAGVTDHAGQRLLGGHLLILAAAYLLIAWRPDRYAVFLWLPFAGQLVVTLLVSYSMLKGETDFGDGILAVAVGTIFVSLLAFVWITEQRTTARIRLEQELAQMEENSSELEDEL